MYIRSESPLIPNMHSRMPPLHVYHCYIKDRTARARARYNGSEEHQVPGGVRGTGRARTPVTSCRRQQTTAGMQIHNNTHLTLPAQMQITHIRMQRHSSAHSEERVTGFCSHWKREGEMLVEDFLKHTVQKLTLFSSLIYSNALH